MGFRDIHFLLFVFGLVLCAPRAVFPGQCQCDWGVMCSTTQYCYEDYYWDQEDQIWDYRYYCQDCPPGQVHSENDCGTCVSYCEGYGTCPDGVGGSDKKCKEVSGGCSTSGCKKYAICNPASGAIEYAATGPCHLENGTCYSNQRNCSLFGEYNLLPVDGTQFSGVAQWVAQGGGYKWDVGNCTSGAENKEYAFTNCDRFSFHGIVRSQNRYIANVQSKITYTTEWAYCSKCKPGAVLTIMNSPTDGVVYRPTDIPGNWGGSYCWEPVQAPNYADGCEIDFSKPTGNDAVTSSSCTKSCSAGYATQEDGATSDNDCEFDTSALFHDATGDFTLGNMTNCPTNGG